MDVQPPAHGSAVNTAGTFAICRKRARLYRHSFRIGGACVWDDAAAPCHPTGKAGPSARPFPAGFRGRGLLSARFSEFAAPWTENSERLPRLAAPPAVITGQELDAGPR
jgi:hypothetical protein